MLNADWQTMAIEQRTLALSQPAESLEWYRHWMYTLIAASRGGDETVRAEAVKELSKRDFSGGEPLEDDPIDRIRWQSLAMHGEIDAAVEIMKMFDSNKASELLAQGSRLADAFEVIDVDWTRLDSQISEIVQDAIQGERSQQNESIELVSPEFARLLTLTRLLVSTGRSDLAYGSLKAVVEHPSLASVDRRAMMNGEIIRTIARLNRTDWIAPLLIESNQRSLSGPIQWLMSMVLDTDIQTVASLLDALEKISPPRQFPERVSDMVTLLSGELPDWFDPSKDFVSLYLALLQERTNVRPPGRAGGMWTVGATKTLHLDLAKLFESHGQPELAKKIWIAMSEDGDVAATLKLAESELNEGSVAVARQSFEQSRKKLDANGQRSSRMNLSEADAFLAMQAIQGESLAARRLGDVDGAQRLNMLIRLMSVTPAMSLRDSFAEFLSEHGFVDEAEAIYKPLMRLTAFGSSDKLEFYAVAWDYDSSVSGTKPGEGAAALDLAIAGTLESTIFHPASYVSLPTVVYRRKVADYITRNDEPAVRAATESLLRLDPIDITFGEKSIEAMRKAGMNELATQTLEKIYQSGREHLDQFPVDVAMSNNLAWVLALSDHRLDEALRISSRAVFYEPESTIYRDTLAEVLYRLGRKDEAIEIEKACLLDDPAEWHVHEQIRRFREPKK